jgi:hypothetical protein
LKKKNLLIFILILTFVIFISALFFSVGNAQNDNPNISDNFYLQKNYSEIRPSYSSDGIIVYEPVPRLILVSDENLTFQRIKIPLDNNLSLTKSNANFIIDYVDAGSRDEWNNLCQLFPDQAKIALDYSSSIWSSIINSRVPIKIRACWTSLDSNILGQSGGYTIYRDFPGAPNLNTWYVSSLANSLYGDVLNPEVLYDINITLNSNFSWYLGTDANPSIGTMDFVTVAAHEIAHGLNFFGSAVMSGTSGSFGYEGYPFIYDIFIRDGNGNLLTSYSNPSISLGSLFISNDLWFHGENAMIGNDNSRVKIYAPSIWTPGSSYSHLDYNTFSGTPNSMMVFALPDGSAYHDPGSVTIGLLKDLGWGLTDSIPEIPTEVQASEGDLEKISISWAVSPSAIEYQVFRSLEDSVATATKFSFDPTNNSYIDSLAEPGIIYYYWVKACNSSGCSDFSQSDDGWRGYDTIPTPEGVSASDGEFNDKVRITWYGLGGVTHYQVFRNNENIFNEDNLLDDFVDLNLYNDITAESGENYYYWVKGCVDTTCSDPSISDIGYRLGIFNVFLPLTMK